MLQRIIFDIDNTLIKWEKSFDDNISSVFEKMKIAYTQKDIENVISSVNEYETKEIYFQRQRFQEIIEEKLQRRLPRNFIDELLQYFSRCVPEKIPESTIDTLAYLCKKYELVTLSNWFEKEQNYRLEKVGIKKYFKECYACENVKVKPNPESFKIAAGVCMLENCLMVGDNLKVDIQGAQNCGMQAIWYNPKGIKADCPNIQHLDELKVIL